MNQLRTLTVDQKINKYVRPIGRTDINNYLNIINNGLNNTTNVAFNINTIKRIFYKKRDYFKNNNLRRSKILIKIFLELHQYLKNNAIIEQNIGKYPNNLYYIQLKITKNDNVFETLFYFDLDDEIKIDAIVNNIEIKGMMYYLFLYIHYIISIIYNFDENLIKRYKIELQAQPGTNKNNPKRLYDYYESFGFEANKENILFNRRTTKTREEDLIDYTVTYPRFINTLYNNIHQLIDTYSERVRS